MTLCPALGQWIEIDSEAGLVAVAAVAHDAAGLVLVVAPLVAAVGICPLSHGREPADVDLASEGVDGLRRTVAVG